MVALKDLPERVSDARYKMLGIFEELGVEEQTDVESVYSELLAIEMTLRDKKRQ